MTHDLKRLILQSSGEHPSGSLLKKNGQFLRQCWANVTYIWDAEGINAISKVNY